MQNFMNMAWTQIIRLTPNIIYIACILCKPLCIKFIGLILLQLSLFRITEFYWYINGCGFLLLLTSKFHFVGLYQMGSVVWSCYRIETIQHNMLVTQSTANHEPFNWMSQRIRAFNRYNCLFRMLSTNVQSLVNT